MQRPESAHAVPLSLTADAGDVFAEDAIMRLSAADAQSLIDAIDREEAPVPQLVELLRRSAPPAEAHPQA